MTDALRLVVALLLFFATAAAKAHELHLERDAQEGTISVYREGEDEPIVTQHARAHFRPYIHPIVAPDGRGILTEFSPDHHKHQTGLYWGFTGLNGRDYFHNPGEGFWKRNHLKIIKQQGDTVAWQTSYDLLDPEGVSVLTEIQSWELHAMDGEYLMDLSWEGIAHLPVVVERGRYGGMFLRMAWRKGMNAMATNSSGASNRDAEGKKAVWLNLRMQVEGREDQAHITIFDHPKNKGFPQAWRVDRQFGVGPSRARSGQWKIAKGDKEVIRHRLVVHTGKFDANRINEKWV
ncbi:MAG: DUF6807 family protein, partial [Verrucomicrobiota bacterium]